jgi:hypothetical protein
MEKNQKSYRPSPGILIYCVISSQVEDVRQETKAEKKRLAMAMRKKQLGALGMQVSQHVFISRNQ